MNRDDDDRDGCPSTIRNERLIDRLFRAEAPRLARLIRRSVKSPDEVHDLVQDTFVNFVASGSRRELRSPEAYLTTIARRLLWGRSHRRAGKEQPRYVEIEEAVDLAVPPEQEWMMEASDVIRRYEQALAELPARTREVFRLSRQEQLSYEEIAKRTGLSERTVKYHMSKALIYLNRRMNGDV